MYVTILNRLILSHVQSILKFVLGEIAPVGPTSFEFVVPEGAPVTVSPSVGTVLPGKVSQNITCICKTKTVKFESREMTFLLKLPEMSHTSEVHSYSH